MSTPQGTTDGIDPIDQFRAAMALDRKNRKRFCGLREGIKPDDQELQAAAQRLYGLAVKGCGASLPAARILFGCYSGTSGFNVGDFRKLDPFNFEAAMIVFNFAAFEGCEKILSDEKMEYLRDLFDLEKL